MQNYKDNISKLELKVIIDLSAVLVSLSGGLPKVLLIENEKNTNIINHRLPFGPFNPNINRTMEESVRNWVLEQTGLKLAFVEQLYTFGDRFRGVTNSADPIIPVSVGYLALIRRVTPENLSDSIWLDWYKLFPWEDWRNGQPKILDRLIKPKLTEWSHRAKGHDSRLERRYRVEVAFGFSDFGWDAERVLERYELLYESGLVTEALIDGEIFFHEGDSINTSTGLPLYQDHRRILATALGRLRSKIRYRPVIFELMPEVFTLFELQKVVEALSGENLHKQNFRRLIESEGLVEQTEMVSEKTGGRPAKLYRFRREVIREKPSPGVRFSKKGSKILN